ncbi:unnamed protein product [Ambrosiozyma monospora]|uniref:Unnamed protein product n=1 Tax=Ambrosiozyma monospora TaxID=43982 RepID=A0ACB5STJ4_AMBMO|nr:unnamed protein product [Ambrosiozyma monospora]
MIPVDGQSTDSTPLKFFDKVPSGIMASLKCARFKTNIVPISPLLLVSELNEYSMSFKISSLGASLKMGWSRFNGTLFSNVKGAYSRYGFVSIDKLLYSILAKPDGSLYDIATKFSLDHLRFNFSEQDVVKMVEMGYADFRRVENNIEMISAKVEQFSGDIQSKNAVSNMDVASGVSSVSAPPADLKKVLEYVRIMNHSTIGVIGFIVKNNHDQIVFDSSNLVLHLSSYDKDLDVNKLNGYLECPSTKLTFALSGPHSSKFTMIDSHCKMNIDNAQSSSEARFNFVSDFCRIALNPYYLSELIETYFLIANSMSKFSLNDSADGITTSGNESVNPQAGGIACPFSVSFVSKNVCVGWLFPRQDQYYRTQSYILPGLTLGYESAEIIFTKNVAKVLMTGMYISGAHSGNPSNFYPLESERSARNRVFFPKFEMMYYRTNKEGGHGHQVKVLGDIVDFKLETSLFSISEPLWSSIAAVQDTWDAMSSRFNNILKPSKSRTVVDESLFVDNIPDDIKSIDCTFRFDGASFVVSNGNLVVNGETPSLCLQSPSLQVAMQYIKASTGIKRHILTLEALTTKTDNTVSCASMPIIHEIIHNCRNLMENAQSLDKKTSVPQIDAADGSAPIKLDRVFEKVKLSASLKIEPQRLSMSCEPRANIEAAVSTKDIYLNFGTDTDMLSGLVYVQDLRAELQHVYSKEITGSVSIENMVLNSTLGYVDGKKELAVTGKVSNIDAYINMQQQQDLDLFVDIWFPEQVSGDVQFSTPPKEESQPIAIASILRDVHKTTAFPWILTAVISKVNMKADFGASLGMLNVSFDKFWAVSRKSMNWDQNLRFEFEKFTVESVGRLSGSFVVDNIRMATGISWRQEQSVSEIPLVLLSGGFKSLECKMSMDYHPFFIIDIKNAMVSLYNQRVKNQVDNLVGKASTESCRIYMTALAASNFVDLYTIVLRIRQGVKISYKQVLHDAEVDRRGLFSPTPMASSHSFSNNLSQDSMVFSSNGFPESAKLTDAFLDVIQKLRTNLDVKLGLFQILVFPSTLLDSQVLALRVGSLNAKFSQMVSDKLENSLVLQLNDTDISLASFKHKPTEESLKASVSEYTQLANSFHGGHLFVFPSVKTSMDLWQALNSNVVQYSYDLRFGGNVDLRWKLGSVYFIRELWYSHATTLKTRLTALRIFTSNYDDKFDENFEEDYKESILETVDLEDKLKDVESDKHFQYIPIQEPYIETPQLKDLGDATPPLEWFGLHRSKFPNLTHQFVIVGLQKMVKHAETRYAKVLK